MKYTQEIKSYPIEVWDEDNDRPTEEIETYRVFTTIQLNKYTFVRAVVDSPTGEPASPRAREWFVEWKVVHGTSYATHRLTRKLTRAEALREGIKAAALIADKEFADTAEAGAFYAQHLPSGPTYAA